MNKVGWLLAALVSVAALSAITGVIRAGPLDPPGPPTTGTMKTLEQVEPRTPISSLPYTISSPGSYYLTGNLSSSTWGIVISADYAEIDLNGFSLVGAGGGAGMESLDNRVTVRNGRVHGWGSGIQLAGGHFEVEDVVVSGNTGAGLTLEGTGAIRRVRAFGNGSVGIWAGGFGMSVFDSEASYNGGDGIIATQGASRIEGNTVIFNFGHGIAVTDDCVVIGNTLKFNNYYGPAGEQGIFVNGSRNRIEGNSVSATDTGDGIRVTGNGNTITNNLIATSAIEGIHTMAGSDGNTITNNQVTGSGHNGIVLEGSRNYVAGNTADGNGTAVAAAGILALSTSWINRFEDNHSTYNSNWGFRIDGSASTIFRNSAAGNWTNYLVAPANDLGPVGTAAAATSPWANISH